MSTKNENTVVKFKFPWATEEYAIIGDKLTRDESNTLMKIVETFLTSDDVMEKLKLGKKRPKGE